MILALLLTGWIWDRPLNCLTHLPETDLAIYWLSATVRVNGLTPCLDDQGLPSFCPAVFAADPIPFHSVPDPGYGLTAGTSDDPTATPELLPEPPLGGMTAWPWPSVENPDPVLVQDTAGNWGVPCF